MKLKKLIKVLSDGTACFSIKGLCEEYGEGLEQLQQELWYMKNRERTVKRIAVIGGGMYKTELCIELED